MSLILKRKPPLPLDKISLGPVGQSVDIMNFLGWLQAIRLANLHIWKTKQICLIVL